MRDRSRGNNKWSWWQLMFLLVGVVLIFYAFERLNAPPTIQVAVVSTPSRVAAANIPPTLSVLPTLTPAPAQKIRQIIFPTAGVVASIVIAVRNGPTWETRYLGDSVGRLEGTGWLDDPGGNIVLAAHVEDAEGKPGPFASLFDSKRGDVVILRDGDQEVIFHVVTIDHAAPDDMRYVTRTGKRHLTLITCTDWDAKLATYQKRLVVVAE